MKKHITILTISASCLLSTSFAAVMAPTPAQQSTATIPVNKIVAIVNNNVITQTQLDQQITVVKAQLQSHNVALPDDNQLKKQVLNQLINRQLQLQLAQRNHIQASNQEINQALQSIAEQNHMSTSQIYAQQEKLGLNRQAFRQQLQDDVIIQKLQQDAMASQITVTPQEIANFIANTQNNPQSQEQYHLADILVSLPSSPSPKQISEAQARANQLLEQLRKGANFQQLAAAHSGSQSALQGGDLGWRTMGELPDAFATNISNLKPGQVAGPIRTGNGFHIIKLIAERTPTVSNKPASSSEKQEAEQMIFQRKMLEDLQSWISQLRAQAYIKIM